LTKASQYGFSNRILLKNFFRNDRTELSGSIFTLLAIFLLTRDNRQVLLFAGLIVAGILLGAIAFAWEFIQQKTALVRFAKIMIFVAIVSWMIWCSVWRLLMPMWTFGPSGRSKCFGLAVFFLCAIIVGLAGVLGSWFALFVWPELKNLPIFARFHR
jgi:hypothetical protein